MAFKDLFDDDKKSIMTILKTMAYIIACAAVACFILSWVASCVN